MTENQFDSSPLGEIAYFEKENEIKWIPPHPYEDVEVRVEETFHLLKWREIYGLTLTDVFNLPYDVWRRLTKRLSDLLKSKDTHTHNEIIIQLLTELNQKMSVLIGQVVSSPNDKKEKNK